MKSFTLQIADLQELKIIQNKLAKKQNLTPDQSTTVINLLNYLPPSETLLQNKFPLNEPLNIEVIEMEEMWPHLKRWINLFNTLPKNGSSHYPYAGLIDESNDENFWLRNVIIHVAFIPSFLYARRGADQNKIINLCFKIDGSAMFDFLLVEDAQNFPELYSFNGSWKEAYLLTVKTLKQGWPQTKFPEEFEQFLKK